MWWEGSIEEAIYLARIAPFPVLIYVRDRFTESKKTDAYFNNPKIKAILTDRCVAIRLEADSPEARQFFSISRKAIPTVCVYFDGAQRLKLADGGFSLKNFVYSLETTLNDCNPFKQSSKPANNTDKKSINYKECNLAIKLPDGKILRKSFEANNTLNQVRDHICENCEIGTSEFNLLQSFPRRLFTIEEEQLSLAELGLCPNNTIVVKLNENAIHTDSDSGDGAFATPFSYIQSGVGMVTGAFNYIFGGTSSSGSGNNSNQNRPANIRTFNSSSYDDSDVTEFWYPSRGGSCCGQNIGHYSDFHIE